MTAPPFALPAADPRDQPAGAPPAALCARERARCLAALGSLGAAAIAATLAAGAAVAVFEHDVATVLARPALVAEEVTVQGFRELAALPGPSPLVLAALVPAVALLLLAGALRSFGVDARPLHGVSLEALGAAERTMVLAVRVIAAGALFVFVMPALLQLVGVQTVSLTTGSMAPALPAGSLLLVTRPADLTTIGVGEVVVIGGPDGSRVTHRVVGLVHGRSGEVSGYRTRGDALATLDPEPIPPSAIDGIVIAGIPLFGALRAWMASPLGIAIGIVLAWAFAGLAALIGDDRRRAVAAREPNPARTPTAAQAVARSRSRPTS